MKHAGVDDMHEFWLENSECGDAFVTANVEIRLIRINIKLKHPQKLFSLVLCYLCFGSG